MKPKRKRLIFQVRPKLDSQLKKLARKRNTNVSALIRSALMDFLMRQEIVA